jgi:hypothetical protein
MKAIAISGKTARLVLDRAVPTPRPDQLLVKVHSVALVSLHAVLRNMSNVKQCAVDSELTWLAEPYRLEAHLARCRE